MGNRTDVFLDQYRQLESVIRDKYDLQETQSPVGFLVRQPEFRTIRTELDYCREVRNLLSHTPKVNNNYGIEPSDDLIELIKGTIQRVQNPPTASRIAIPREKILCKEMTDYVLPTMKDMNEHVFTHIPILRDGSVIGVFSENTILSYLIDEEIVCIDADTRFVDMEKYLPLSAHKAESFRFVARNTSLGSITSLFEEALTSTDRIGMVFVTNSGKPTEKLLGIITAWDIAGIG